MCTWKEVSSAERGRVGGLDGRWAQGTFPAPPRSARARRRSAGSALGAPRPRGAFTPGPAAVRVHGGRRKAEPGALRAPHERPRARTWPAEGAEQPSLFGGRRGRRRRRREREVAVGRRGSWKSRVGPGRTAQPRRCAEPASCRGDGSEGAPLPIFQPLLWHFSGPAFHPRADVEGQGPGRPPALPRPPGSRVWPACCPGTLASGCALHSGPAAALCGARLLLFELLLFFSGALFKNTSLKCSWRTMLC